MPLIGGHQHGQHPRCYGGATLAVPKYRGDFAPYARYGRPSLDTGIVQDTYVRRFMRCGDSTARLWYWALEELSPELAQSMFWNYLCERQQSGE